MKNIEKYLTSSRQDALTEISRINSMRAKVMARNNRKGITTEKQKKQYQAGLDIEKVLNGMSNGDYRGYLYFEGIRNEPSKQARMKLI